MFIVTIHSWLKSLIQKLINLEIKVKTIVQSKVESELKKLQSIKQSLEVKVLETGIELVEKVQSEIVHVTKDDIDKLSAETATTLSEIKTGLEETKELAKELNTENTQSNAGI